MLTPNGRRKNVDVGDPHDFSRPLIKSPIDVGSWACTPGGWDSPSPRPTTEYFYVLSGAGCVTDPDGTRHPFGPGDSVVLPKGWYGRWDITETIHKIYVINNHPVVPGASLRPVVASVSLMSVFPTVIGMERATASSELYDTGSTTVGYWTSTPGGFTSSKKVTEVFFVLEGEFYLTNADGSARRCGAGDTVVLPKGWSGRWDVIKTVKKLFVEVSRK